MTIRYDRRTETIVHDEREISGENVLAAEVEAKIRSLAKKLDRAIAYGSRAGEIAEHFGLPVQRVRHYIRARGERVGS